ncbi:MAG: S1 family peptidase [Candidatus Acidiferrales bacterium]
MKKMLLVFTALLAPLVFCSVGSAQNSPITKAPPAQNDFELNSVLMECTFMLEGRTAQGQQTLGTGFIMGRPIPNQSDRGQYVLITAAHVLNGMAGDTVLLHLRRKIDENKFEHVPYQIAIRSNGQPLWTENPSADVAVMYIRIPNDIVIPILPTTLLADDKTLLDFQVHPGDELECLGYPLGSASNDAGFPILRSGRVASYPLLPTATTKTFLLDVRVFKGNSGGPVYLWDSNRLYHGSIHFGTVGFIMGLISQEELVPQVTVGPYDQSVHQLQLDLAVVIHANLIKQTIDMLPAPQ